MPTVTEHDLDEEMIAELRRVAAAPVHSGREAQAKVAAIRTLERLGRRKGSPLPDFRTWHPTGDHATRVGRGSFAPVFETATWTLRNRRLFAALERLGQISGSGVVTDTESLDGLSDAGKATAIADAGLGLLGLLIRTAAGKRKARKVLREMNGETGARAAVFLSHGMAATTERLAESPGHHLSADRQREARELLWNHFPWSDDEEGLIEEQAEQIDSTTAAGLEEARAWLAFHALSMIVGGENAARLPAFAAFDRGYEHDGYLLDQHFGVAYRYGGSRWLQLTDPDGLFQSSRYSAL